MIVATTSQIMPPANAAAPTNIPATKMRGVGICRVIEKVLSKASAHDVSPSMAPERMVRKIASQVLTRRERFASGLRTMSHSRFPKILPTNIKQSKIVEACGDARRAPDGRISRFMREPAGAGSTPVQRRISGPK